MASPKLDDTAELPKPVISKDGKFNNPWPTAMEPGLGAVMKWMVTERRGSPWLSNKDSPSTADWEAQYPVLKPDLSTFWSPPSDILRALWVGHSTLLVQIGGLTFLTDPVFSDRCSPFQFMGPKRLAKTPFKLDDPQLPRIDFVVISHDHYDHLDLASVKQLNNRFGAGLTWYVPLKLGRWFEGVGVPKASIVEMDWWQQVQHKDTKVTVACTPAQHWSNRGVNKQSTLWASYVVFTPSLRFWFAGDTGYCPVFKQIGDRFGPFDLTAIPIGAYQPRWFMKYQHIEPKHSVMIHKELRSKRSLAMHCCTFYLTDEAVDEPPRLLLDEMRAQGLTPDEFVALQHGGHITTAGGVDSERSPQLSQI